MDFKVLQVPMFDKKCVWWSTFLLKISMLDFIYSRYPSLCGSCFKKGIDALNESSKEGITITFNGWKK